MAPSVLFVSKPIAAPFRDGTQCLVRDLALHFTEHRALVMGVAGETPDWAAQSRAEILPIYPHRGGFAPGLLTNARAARWLWTSASAELWHYVFAPNLRTSLVGRWLKRTRRVPVVQTIASPPRSFADIDRLLFGDVVVAQSEWTRRQILAQPRRSTAPPVVVIPPPAPSFTLPDPGRIERALGALGIAPGLPVYVYPGDLETSIGAETVARAVEPVARRVPEAVFVFAYRAKTDRASELAARLRRRLDPRRVRLSGEVEDMHALLAGSTAVLFPVDDLRGKVDMPIVLLESMTLGIPVIVFAWGPLAELGGVLSVPVHDEGALVDCAVRVALDVTVGPAVGAAEQRAVTLQHGPGAIASRYEQLYRDLRRPSRRA